MIQSLFIVNRSGDVCLEKHWVRVTPKSVCDAICESSVDAASSQQSAPVIELSNTNLCHIIKDELLFVAVFVNEFPPLLVVEFLNAVYTILEEYFGVISEASVRDNTVCIFEILDEMLDGGFPLTTEPNILREIVRPPNLIKALTEAVVGKNSMVSSFLPACQLSNVRWRRSGVKYTNNELYFDMIESVDAIIDRSGNTILKAVHGSIECHTKLSGVPDLTLAFSNHRLIDDASLHPCVRFLRWKRERVLSFIPPDGHFCLMNYEVNCLSPLTLPISIRHNIVLKESGSRLDLIVISKTLNRVMEAVKITIIMPPGVVNVHCTPSTGRTNFDVNKRIFDWDIGRIESKNPNPSLRGQVVLQSGLAVPPENPSLVVSFSVPQHAISGLKIARVDLYSEKYKPFKGVKYLTRSGKYEIRT
ncbi:AP-3 complex subunit mu-1 [Fasciola gigantica]|uniref:AP-3 complex subunit mu-1 n=1 Tax=Fasciola gigantica TaxID=46835 RepID=A0A504YSW1_FASGI|nr:AP-3 complex subunit mu-1 [Fasciola gigantica]